jgi:succinoglycan biosynthesis transport protein ExoP
MLQVNKPQVESIADRSVPEPELISPRQIYTTIEGFMRRQFAVIAFVLLVALGLGGVYLFTTPPKYTGHTVLVIDPHKSQIFSQQSPLGDLPIDSATVDTQLEILRSDSIALAVVKDLHLNEDPEFIRPRPGFVVAIIGRVMGYLLAPFASLHEPQSDFQLMRAAAGTVQSRLSAKRVGLTYAIEIDFQAFNPVRAAQIANGVADAYMVGSLEAKYQTTRRAAMWLQDRLKELREQSLSAERAVVEFKAKNNIVETGGRLINEQQLTELNTALIQARAHSAEAQARLERVEQILKSDAPDSATTAAATVADTLQNQVITKLRQQYLDLQAHESDWSNRMGPDHLAVINVRNQMREIRHSILDELQRIAETYKSDYQIAKTREESVQRSLADIVTQSQTTNEAQVTLHGLDSSAQTYRSLYDNFLQRYMESVQQQSFPVSEARVITQAVGGYRSAPNSVQAMMLAAMGGLVLGIGIGLLREISDRVFRTTGQVEEILHADCIAIVPLMKNNNRRVTPDGRAAKSTLVGARAIRRDRSLLWEVAEAPFSRFVESIRAIKVATDLSRLVKDNKVIGVTSSVPNEGKSTLAAACAGLISHSGSAAVLVDCDLRNPSLTRALAPAATSGILELIAGKAKFDDVVWTDPATKLLFIPAVVQSRLAFSSDILASDAMRRYFEKLRASYEYVIVDLSPLAPVVDVRAMSHLVDSFLFVVEWGRTNFDMAEHALDMAPGVHQNLLGVILNKVDMNAIGRYEAYRGNYYYKRYYARYGYAE